MYHIITLCFLVLHTGCVAGVAFDPSYDLNGARFCENLPIGEYLHTIVLTDVSGSDPTLTIQTVQFSEYVTVTKNVSIPFGFDLNVKKPFDREAASTMSGVFLAQDGNDFIQQTSTISIKDDNDNAPVFGSLPYIVDVFEDPWSQATLLTVIASDRDDGVAGSVQFAMEASSTNALTVTTNSGIVTAKSPQTQFDFELNPVIIETVRASDGGGGSCNWTAVRSTTAQIVVNIKDGPDTPPFFTDVRYSTTMEETNIAGPVGLQVKALDGDLDLNWTISYSILPKEGIDGVFEIDSATGIISVVGNVDRESPASLNNGGLFVFQVMALEVDPMDTSLPNDIQNFIFNTTVDVTITVTDIDDNAPTFFYLNSTSDTSTKVQQNKFQTEIPEATSNGISVPNLNIYVQDIDGLQNAQFSLSLTAGGDVFSISPSSVNQEASVTLIVKNSTLLDYSTQKYILVEIAAKSSSWADVLATVNVTITDINNHSPVFDNVTFTGSVPENSDSGTEILAIQATDDDAGTNAELTYTLQNSDRFEVNATTGQVSVIGDLDREATSMYYLAATVTDGGGRRDVATIVVNVTDINDNPPIFQRSSYVANVAENSTEFTNQVLLNVIDDDEPGNPNSEVSFTIVAGDLFDNFKIIKQPNSQTQAELVVKSPVDLESLNPDQVVCSGQGTGTILLEVMASDGGTPTLNSTVNVSVTVQDINDHSPKFSQDLYEAEIPEKSQTDTIVIQVSANDSDACDPNNLVEYEIGLGGNTTSSDVFYIKNSEKGIIQVLNSQLDRDEQATYWVEVIAVDTGANRLSATAMVVVTLQDINNKSPILDPTSLENAEVEERSANDTVIREIVATDPDHNPDLVYYITGITCSNTEGNVADCGYPFKIDTNASEQVGLLKVNGELDRESISTYEVQVEVQDLNASSNLTLQIDSGFIQVLITDVNDNYPEFASGTSLTVNEGERNSFVGQVSCTDLDIGINAEILYSVDPSSAHWINVDNLTGIVTTNNSFDRETQGNSINVTLIASDLGQPSLSTSQQFTIDIIDVNDNTPQIITNSLTAVLEVEENKDSDTYVFQVNATDDDIGANAALTYILRMGFEQFSINETNGKIFTKVMFDAETSQLQQITVEVRDNGPSPRSSEITLDVNILDVDDNEPYYAQGEKEFNINVTEEQDPFMFGTIPVSSDDDVLPENHISYYFIVGGTNESLFALNSSLQLFTTGLLDRELQDYFDLVIQVSSENSTKLSGISWDDVKSNNSMLHVLINVVDINDNAPIFDRKFYETDIAFDAAASPETLFQVVASDVDIQPELLYTITSSVLVVGDVISPSPDIFGITQLDNKGNVFLNGAVNNDVLGHYEITIEVTDGVEGHMDVATANVRIVQSTETVILHSDYSPAEFANMQSAFESDFSDLLKAQVIVDKVVPHVATDSADLAKSDIYFHAVNNETKELMPKDDVIKILNKASSLSLLNKYAISGFSDAVVVTNNNSEQNLKIAIIAVIVVLAIVIILCLASFIVYHRKLKAKLRFAKAIEESNEEMLKTNRTQTEIGAVPNSNMFVGANPIFGENDENKTTLDWKDKDETSDSDDGDDSAVVADSQDYNLNDTEPDFGGGQSNAQLLAALSAATESFGEDNLASVFDNLDDTSF